MPSRDSPETSGAPVLTPGSYPLSFATACWTWPNRCEASGMHRNEPTDRNEKQATSGRYIDDEEKELVAAYDARQFKPVRNQSTEKRSAVEAAKRYTRKDARISIRLSTADLEMLKRRSAEEGLSYQSLIASILHKYVSASRLGFQSSLFAMLADRAGQADDAECARSGVVRLSRCCLDIKSCIKHFGAVGSHYESVPSRPREFQTTKANRNHSWLIAIGRYRCLRFCIEQRSAVGFQHVALDIVSPFTLLQETNIKRSIGSSKVPTVIEASGVIPYSPAIVDLPAISILTSSQIRQARIDGNGIGGLNLKPVNQNIALSLIRL